MRPKAYVWSGDYEAAVLELDPPRLKSWIAKAEATINQRRAELLQESAPCAEELQAISQALRVLAILREISERCA